MTRIIFCKIEAIPPVGMLPRAVAALGYTNTIAQPKVYSPRLLPTSSSCGSRPSGSHPRWRATAGSARQWNVNGRTVSGSAVPTILHALTCGLHRGRATIAYLTGTGNSKKVARYRRERMPMEREWPDRQWVCGIHHSPRLVMRPASRPRHHRLSKTDLAATQGGALPPGAHANEMGMAGPSVGPRQPPFSTH